MPVFLFPLESLSLSGVTMECNKDCHSVNEEMLMKSPFRDKGRRRALWQACCLLSCGKWLERDHRIFRGVRGL